jgi:hypothetical protein
MMAALYRPAVILAPNPGLIIPADKEVAPMP